MATSVKIHPLAHEALQQLKACVEAEEGRNATDREIVSALIYGATPAQAAGMLIAFTRAAAQAGTAGDPPADDAPGS